jgi:hypothetical protein
MKTISLMLLGFLFSCKTVSRDDFATQMTDVSVKIPEELKDFDTKISFSRVDSKAKPKIVRGPDVKVRLPSGQYRVNLTLADKGGTEEFEACDTTRRYEFTQLKVDAIIDICRKSDRSLVAKTMRTEIVLPPVIEPVPTDSKDPPVKDKPVGEIPPVVTEQPGVPDQPTIPEKPIVPEKPVVTDPVLFEPETKCFGMPASFTREGTEIVVKPSGEIKDFIFESGNYLTCSVTFNIPKDKGKGFAPTKYSIKFETDESTLKYKHYFRPLVKDEAEISSLPCRLAIMVSADQSEKYFECSFYDTTPEKFGTVTESNRLPYEKSCNAESKRVRMEITLVGKTATKISTLKIPEVRIGIPYTEKCL